MTDERRCVLYVRTGWQSADVERAFKAVAASNFDPEQNMQQWEQQQQQMRDAQRLALERSQLDRSAIRVGGDGDGDDSVGFSFSGLGDTSVSASLRETVDGLFQTEHGDGFGGREVAGFHGTSPFTTGRPMSASAASSTARHSERAAAATTQRLLRPHSAGPAQVSSLPYTHTDTCSPATSRNTPLTANPA